jgi:hypothetical protein
MFHHDRDDKPDPIEIHVTLDIKGLEASGAGELKALIQHLTAIVNTAKDQIMTSAADFQAGFARIDKATTVIAERLRTLSQNIGSMSGAEEDAAKAQLEALATTLETMGANPDNPVPTPVPPEEPPVTP